MDAPRVGLDGDAVRGALRFRVIGPDDARILDEIFRSLDRTYFRPHPFSAGAARRIAARGGRDVYALLLDQGHPVAYGMLRGWDEGYATPSLGIAVRPGWQGQGLGRLMMAHLHEEAARGGATQVRLRVHPANLPARRLYESMGYAYRGTERGELVMILDLAPGMVEDDTAYEREGVMVRLLHPDASECIEFLRKVRHDFYHLPTYGELCAARERGTARSLVVDYQDGRLLLPIIRRPIDGTDRFDVVSPYGYPGPVTERAGDDMLVSAALDAGFAGLRAAGAVSAFIRFHPLINPVPPDGVSGVVTSAVTVGVDLSLSETELWDQMRENHRRDIRRALRDGFAASVDTEFAEFDTFKRLYRETMLRRNAREFYLFDDSHWDGLRRALGRRLHLLTVKAQGRVAGAALFVETGGLVQYHLMGVDAAVRHAEASKLLLHSAALWAKERGNHHLHLGGGVGGANDSLLHFKSGFSPLRHRFHTLRVILDEREYSRLCARQRVAVGNDSLGEAYFPAYRAGGIPAD